MKKIYLSILLLLAVCSVKAQTTAQNWTKNDCAGRSHNLFAELDSGNVVVLEYVMMNCGSCIVAGNGLKNITAPYATSHPGRVLVYSIGYTNSYTCTQMTDWKTTNNFTHPVFTDGAADVAYYGGMGMPTIVVVGNNSHSVFYKKLGYASADNAAITAAINQALAASGQTGISEFGGQNVKVNLFPNPSNEVVNLNFDAGSVDEIKVTNLTGRLVANYKVAPGNQGFKLETTALKNGLYLVHFLKADKFLATHKFVKAH